VSRRVDRRELVIGINGVSEPTGIAPCTTATAAGRSGVSGDGAVSGATAVRAPGVPDGRIDLLPDGTHVVLAALDRDRARRELGWAPDRFVVAHTGSMGLKQDLRTVVEAARRLPDGVDVLLIGDGTQHRALQAQAAGVSGLRFLDPLDDATQPLALAASDLLLLSERPAVGERPAIAHQSLPDTLISYLGAGRAVLAAVPAESATATELARTRGAGLVVRPGDPDLLARSILELRSDDALREAMGRAGWRYAHARLDTPGSTLRLGAIVDDLLGLS
jgi:colanic acid biosynthesis glycosyl transferase WcaI